jgi:quercetin dioxygenase-like cupin family protein
MKPEYHQKGWGYEMWIHNDADYCGKLLFFEKGKRCSYHYHKLKIETFYLQDGKMLIMHGDSDNYGEAKETLLTAGDVFEVPIGLRHQMVALTDCNLFEFSTQHFEEDSYRVLKGD